MDQPLNEIDYYKWDILQAEYRPLYNLINKCLKTFMAARFEDLRGFSMEIIPGKYDNCDVSPDAWKGIEIN